MSKYRLILKKLSFVFVFLVQWCFCGENTLIHLKESENCPFTRSILKLTSFQAQIKFLFLILVVALACWTTIDAEGRVK